MCARTEAQRVRKSVSTFAPSATNSPILHLLGENASSLGLLQSAGPRATKTDKLTGNGVPTSIGALSV